jgi:hypothetical protein
MTSKELSLEAIQFKLAHVADWRRSLVEKFPDDRRNRRAAVALDELAKADPHQVTPETWSALGPHLESLALRSAVSEAARDVEFRRRGAVSRH